METKTFDNFLNNKYINKFGNTSRVTRNSQVLKSPYNTDFPTINEDYRGKKYCIAYGLSAFAYSRTALVKKNVCNSEEDKVGEQRISHH